MKLKSLIVSCAMLAATTLFAQTNKPVLTVENFTGSINPQAITMLRNQVIAGIQKSGRVDVIDINNEAALKAEQERRMKEEAMADAGRVEEMKSLMSNCILKGNVDNFTVTREQYKTLDGKMATRFVAVVNFSLSILNASNGTLVSQQNFTSRGTGDTEQLAGSDALSANGKYLERFINNAYRAEGKVVELDDQDAKKVKTLYISLGTDDGVQKGQKIEVFKEVTIGGQVSKKLVGEITIQEVMGPSVSLCKVNKGGDVILSEFGKGTSLPVRTKEQKAGFFDF
ncbi:MAG: hypothetical protein HDR89_08775 [Bacteroides sp.]|nr:hypothetical protein [Bacteroides sp.]MBD5350959.1 hypothetical protein [Bacteroides sp.]MBD5421938.1 hypothetical protein [Bacteroides sp.]